MKNCLRIFFLLLLIGFLFPGKSFAQTFGSNVALNLNVADQSISGGNLVMQSSNGIIKTQTTYQSKMIGVAVDDPTIVLHDKTATTRAIVGSGEAPVLVNNSNGAVHQGDFITSSGTPGIGMRGTNAGYVLGVAESNPSNVQNGVGTVLVAVNIHYAATSPSQLDNPAAHLINAFTTSLDNPSRVSLLLRYLVGAFIAFMAFVMGMYLFGRSIRTGIEAIGRNPLARASIQFSIIVNLLLVAFVTLAGIIAAFIIIRF